MFGLLVEFLVRQADTEVFDRGQPRTVARLRFDGVVNASEFRPAVGAAAVVLEENPVGGTELVIHEDLLVRGETERADRLSPTCPWSVVVLSVYKPQPYLIRSRPEALRTVRLRLVPLPLRANIEYQSKPPPLVRLPPSAGQ